MPSARRLAALVTIAVVVGFVLTTIALSRSRVDELAVEGDPATTVAPSTIEPDATATTARTGPTTTTTFDAASLPTAGTGEFEYAGRDGPSGIDLDGSPMIEFSVAAEDGSGVDPDELAAFVDATLADDRSWPSEGVGFRRLAEGGQFTLVVATPDTVDEICLPLRTNGIFSCAQNGYVALNLHRWLTATDEWPTDLDTYRRYVVNHEVGHYVLGPAHPPCPGPGEPAPIMMQQTKGLDGCEPNGWVQPE